MNMHTFIKSSVCIFIFIIACNIVNKVKAEDNVIPPIPSIEDIDINTTTTTTVENNTAEVTDNETIINDNVVEDNNEIMEGDGIRGRVTASNLNIRSGPSSDKYEIVTTLKRGTEVVIVGEREGWYTIFYPPHHPCYISTSAIDGEVPSTINRDGVALPVKGDDISIHVRPWKKSTVVGKANQGDIVTIVGKRGNYYAINPTLNTVAWTSSKYIKTIDGKTALPKTEAPKPGVVYTKPKPKKKVKKKPEKEELVYRPSTNKSSFYKFMRKFKKIDIDAIEAKPVTPAPKEKQATLNEIEQELARIKAETERRKREIAQSVVTKEDEIIPLPDNGKINNISNIEIKESDILPNEITGWVEFTGYGAKRPAAYRLIKGGEIIFLLRSGKYNLREFVNQRIAVDGEVQEAPGWEANVLIVNSLRLLGKGPAKEVPSYNTNNKQPINIPEPITNINDEGTVEEIQPIDSVEENIIENKINDNEIDEENETEEVIIPVIPSMNVEKPTMKEDNSENGKVKIITVPEKNETAEDTGEVTVVEKIE